MNMMHDDVIDSRDVMERIAELQDARMPWLAGLNMAGYMPDEQPSPCASWAEARGLLVEELEDRRAHTCTGSDDPTLQDIADALHYLNGLEGDTEFTVYAAGYAYSVNTSEHDGLDQDDYEELRDLLELSKECENLASAWLHGEPLIARTYFVQYIEDLIDECYELPKEFHRGGWPYRYITIDYQAAADEAEGDYTSVEYQGREFLIRSF